MLRHKAGASGSTDPDKQQRTKLGGWQAVSFIKVVTKTTSSALTVPAPFVRQHGDKIQKFTVLQSDHWDKKLWTVEVGVNFPHGRPQVFLCSGGWKEFAAVHALVRGDRLVFTLVAANRFHVSILRGDKKNSRSLPSSPKKSTRPTLDSWSQPKSSSGQVCIDLTRDERMPDEGDAFNGVEMSSSDMDSRFFEPV